MSTANCSYCHHFHVCKYRAQLKCGTQVMQLGDARSKIEAHAHAVLPEHCGHFSSGKKDQRGIRDQRDEGGEESSGGGGGS